MRKLKLSLLACVGLLACSGKYDVGTDPMGSAGSGNAGHGAEGNDSPSLPQGGTSAGVPMPTAGSFAVAGTSAVGGSAPGADVLSSYCGVPPGQPKKIAQPISNYMGWWFRTSKLIWPEAYTMPPFEIPLDISYEQAGQMADQAMDRAIAETGGIPGAELFLARWLKLSNPTFKEDWAALLGASEPALDTLLTQRFDGKRVGAFTEPAFLVEHPQISTRGNVMVEALFRQLVPPPPPSIENPDPVAGLTRRENMELVTEPQCRGCHQLMDPAGFSLETFDETGEYRTIDAGKPVDTSGTLVVPANGDTLSFTGIADLGAQLTDRCSAQLAFVDNFLIFALAGVGGEYPDLETMFTEDRARIRQAYLRGGRTYRSLVKAFAQGYAVRAP